MFRLFIVCLLFNSMAFATDSNGVTATRWFSGSSFYVEFKNNSFGYDVDRIKKSHDLVCEVIYSLDITDLNTYTTFYGSYPVVIKNILIRPGESKVIHRKVDIFNDDLKPIENIRIDNSSESTQLHCERLKTESDLQAINSISFLISIGKLKVAYSYLRFIKNQDRFNVLDLSGRELNISLKDLEDIKRNLGVEFININYTNLQDSQFKIKSNRVCKLRHNAICGVVYNQGSGKECGKVAGKYGESSNCGAKVYNSKPDSNICGVIYNIKESLSVCGCKVPVLGVSFLGVKLRIGCQKAYKCRNSEFGIYKVKSCRHKTFGVEEYHKCRDVHKGYDKNFKCIREEFGLAKLNSCYLEVKDNELIKCSYSAAAQDLLDLDF